MNAKREGGFLIAKIHQLGGRIFARKLKEHEIDINPAQGRIMFVLWQEDGIPISELARKASLGKSTLTSMLDRLEQAGFLMRVPSAEDRRILMVKRTEKDRSKEREYVRVSQEMTDLFYEGFSQEEIDTFEGSLRHIFENLTAAEP